MECAECGFDNREGIKFCEECGSKLEIVCPSCGAKVPFDRKFCGECGQSLLQSLASPTKDLSFDEKLAKIQKYLPSGLSEKILAQRDKIEGERRQVTIMFVDMKGFTPLTEKLGPEETFSLMDQVFELMIHKVHDYEGTVNELRGDGILALFGAPLALEDGPQRAIRASLAMHREMVKFSEKVKAERGIPPIQVRIGINTGPVVVGTLGNDLRVQFTAVGDTINMAARMEQIAEPGTTYVTEDTFKLAEGFFRFEALGEKEIKGKEQPMKVYRVLAAISRRTRFDVSAERGLTRFIGRERELEILIDAFERAKSGRGQAVSLVGEAGVGKSRLLYEFRKTVANEDVTFLEGKCLSYGRGVAYHPLIDVLKANFDVGESDEDAEIREKVKDGLGSLGMDKASTLPYFLELLSVEDSGVDKIQMSPEGKKDRIAGALIRIVQKGSEIRPLIIAFEDLHWMDKSSEDVSKYLQESIAGARVLMIFTYRPEFVHTWGGKSYHSQLNLNRLSNRETLAMVIDILRAQSVDPAVEDLILEKTEGIPFFIEEFVRSLRDLHIITRTDNNYFLATETKDVTIPSTIQDVIMARLDSLPGASKEVLQAGSAIEREFSYALIKAVTELPENELLSHLSALKDSELLYERGIFPLSTFVFKHALTREVVYDSMLAGIKKKLHEKIGHAIENLYKENIEGQHAVLAQHYVTGENWRKGAKHARLAGKKAAKTGSMTDAITHAANTVESLLRLPESPELTKKIIDARTVLGLYYLQIGYSVESNAAVAPIVDLAIKHDYTARLSQIYTIQGAYECWCAENFSRAFHLLEKALEIATEINDAVSMVFASFWLGFALAVDCRFEKALSCIEKGRVINEAVKSSWGVSVFESHMTFPVHFFQGRQDLSYVRARDAVVAADASGDIFSKAIARSAYGIACHGKGFLEEASNQLLTGIDLCEKSKVFVWNAAAQLVMGETKFESGGFSTAIDHWDKAIRLLGGHGVGPSWANMGRLALAKAELKTHQGTADLQPLYVCIGQNKMKAMAGWIRRHLGEILLTIDNRRISEAQHWIEEAIEADERNGMRFHLGRDVALYAELFKHKGDIFQAKEQLGKAIEIYKECGADGWVTKTQEVLTRL